MTKYTLQQKTSTNSELTHLLIESENLEFLINELKNNEFGLQNSIDLCYIDPPYNTGNTEATNFTYNDSFKKDEWYEFMKSRLLPLKALLRKTGVIITSIDDSEVHHLRVLMDEVFGARNFIAQLVIDGGNPKNNARYFSVTHEYMLVYANNINELGKSGIKWRKEREGIDDLLHEYEKLKKGKKTNSEITAHLKVWIKTQPFSKRLKVFYNADNKGLYTYADLSTPGQGGQYDVMHPLTHKACQIPSRGWGLSEEKMLKLISDDMILFGVDEKAQPLKKLYLKNTKDQVQKAILEYPSRSSTHLLEKLLGRRSSFNNAKNLQMMKDIISLTVPKNGIVLDYFAGSGTTGHAVLELNRENKEERKFVLVTNNENNIFVTVTKPRLLKVHDLLKDTDNISIYAEE